MKRSVIQLSLVYICVLVCTLGVSLLNRCSLTALPLYGRLLCRSLIYWLIAAAPIADAMRSGMRFSDLGFSSEKLPAQIFTGIAAALAMSALLTLIPHLTGFGDWVDDGSRFTHLRQYLYDLFFCIFAVGAVEETVFRGYFYTVIRETSGKEWIAVLGSSILFGFLHVFQGNPLQILMTALLGALFCALRLKVKTCSLLSLMIAHGVYDALIGVWASVLN